MHASAFRRHTLSSPSVTLEKGAYRIYSRRSRLALGLNDQKMNRRLMALGLLLIFAVVTSFGSAYYLFQTGWVTHSGPLSEPVADAARPVQVVEFERDIDAARWSQSSRYLSYLPHSGFHNQRIALENALIMARLLNRTLLVPPVRLGKGILTYYPFDHLYELLALSGKDALDHCADSSSWKELPIECADYYDYTLVPWQWLTNISAIAADQPLIERWNMSDHWLCDYLGITENDTFVIKDVNPYQHRFVDADPLDMPGSHFDDVVSLSLLSRLPQRHLQLGTLFGSSRLRLRRQRNIETRKEVRESMVFTNNILLELAESIKSRLGGQYLAAHVRLGDGQFERAAEKNVRMIWWRLVRQNLAFSENRTSTLESHVLGSDVLPHLVIPEDISALRTPHPDLPPLVQAVSHSRCRSTVYPQAELAALNTPLFISTDVADPATHPLMQRFFKTFPCTFVLSDFSDEIANLSRLKSGYDGLILREFLLPFLDAIVAGKAYQLAGTEGSTFSQFVQDVLWRRYHGFDIVQRG